MKPIGVVGGIGPESTIDYYRAMIAAYRERQPDGSYPAIVINSIDASVMLGALMRGELDAGRRPDGAELERLARAGAGVALIAANSPHVVFDEVQRRSPLPLVSIVEATRARGGAPAAESGSGCSARATRCRGGSTRRCSR